MYHFTAINLKSIETGISREIQTKIDSKRVRELNSPITIEAIEKVVKEMY